MTKEPLTLGILILTLGCSRSEVVHFKYKINKNTTLAKDIPLKLQEMKHSYKGQMECMAECNVKDECSAVIIEKSGKGFLCTLVMSCLNKKDIFMSTDHTDLMVKVAQSVDGGKTETAYNYCGPDKTCIRSSEGFICQGPIDCKWGTWSPWQQCSVTCGHGGTTTRTRTQVVEPAFGGKECEGREKQNQGCNVKPCSDIIKKGHLVTKIKTWGPEYRIQFKIRLKGPFPTTRALKEPNYNLVLFTKNKTHCKSDEYGCRIPAVHFRQVDNQPIFCLWATQKRGGGQKVFENIWQWNKWYTIIIERKVKDGKGKLTVSDVGGQNGKAHVMWKSDDTEATEYTDVFWFQSSPWHDSVGDFADIDHILVHNNGKMLRL